MPTDPQRRLTPIHQTVCILGVLAAICSSMAAQVGPAAGGPVEEIATPIQLAQYPGAPLEDHQGNLWFGTVGEGLVRYDGNEFVTFTVDDGLGSNTIRGILEDNDKNLWIATTGGLSRLDGGRLTTLTAYDVQDVTRTFGPQGDHRDLWDVIVDRHGNLWIATMDGVFRHEGGRFERFALPVVGSKAVSEFTPRMVYCIYEDRDGDLWFGTDGAGVVRYDGSTMTVYSAEADGLCSDNVCAVFQDSSGAMWFGTSNGGVSRYDDLTFTTHLRTEEYSRHHGWGRYMAILEDNRGDIWFGASYSVGGVYRYDGASFVHFGAGQGIGRGGVPSIREDRDGTLWFGTTAGVYHYDGKQFINFSRSDPRLPVVQGEH